MDRRQQKTRDAIFTALSLLLQTKRYEQITVQNIIDTANIGRSTFYAHFETKDDLLRSLCKQIFDHIFSDALIGEQSHDFSQDQPSLPQRLTHLLYHLRDQRSIVASVLSGDSRNIFLHYFTSYLTTLFSNEITTTPDIPHEYTLHLSVCAFEETVIWWVSTGMVHSPEQTISFYQKTISLP